MESVERARGSYSTSGHRPYSTSCEQNHITRSILRNAVVESAVVGALGTIAGLAFGLTILGWIVNVVSHDTYPELGLPITLSPGSVATAAAVGIVAVGLSPLLGARRLRQMDIPSTLRVVE